MNASPAEVRIRMVRAVEGGMAHTEVARVFALSTRTIRRDGTPHREDSDLTPGQSPGRPPRMGAEHADAWPAQVAAHADATRAEHCARWAQEQGVIVREATMSRTLHGLAISINKRPRRRGAG